MGGIHRPTTQLGVHDPSAWATTGTITTGSANQRGLTPLNSPDPFEFPIAQNDLRLIKLPVSLVGFGELEHDPVERRLSTTVILSVLEQRNGFRQSTRVAVVDSQIRHRGQRPTIVRTECGLAESQRFLK
jgi:hypothetical protein